VWGVWGVWVWSGERFELGSRKSEMTTLRWSLRCSASRLRILGAHCACNAELRTQALERRLEKLSWAFDARRRAGRAHFQQMTPPHHHATVLHSLEQHVTHRRRKIYAKEFPPRQSTQSPPVLLIFSGAEDEEGGRRAGAEGGVGALGAVVLGRERLARLAGSGGCGVQRGRGGPVRVGG
jgi:hypothetical protein